MCTRPGKARSRLSGRPDGGGRALDRWGGAPLVAACALNPYSRSHRSRGRYGRPALRTVGHGTETHEQEDDMSTEEGGPGKSRKDVTNRARQRASPEPAFRRILAGISAAIATMHSKASSSSLSAWEDAHIPPAWRRPRRLGLVGALLAAIALIIATRPGATTMPPRHPAPGTTVFQTGQRVVLRFVHSAGRVHVTAGPDGQVSITQNRSGITEAIHPRYPEPGELSTVTHSIYPR